MRRLAAVVVGLGVSAASVACGSLLSVGESPSEADADAGASADPTGDGASTRPDGGVTDGGGIEPGDGAPVVPACLIGEVRCQGACFAGSDCAQCAGATYLCGPTRTCVAACASCSDLMGAAMPIECIACDSTQKNPLGSCEYAKSSSFCLSGDYSKAYKGGPGAHCDCANTNVANCLGNSQVCRPDGGTDVCITCGEANMGTNALSCKGGGKCNASLSPPRCQ